MNCAVSTCWATVMASVSAPDREAGREDAKNPGGAVTVGEVAPRRRSPAQQEHDRGGHRGRSHEQDRTEREIHRVPHPFLRVVIPPMRLPAELPQRWAPPASGGVSPCHGSTSLW